MSSKDDTDARPGVASVARDAAPRVLHVDDDEGFADMTATMLERRGLPVVVETDPRDALDRLAGERVDCVVSDYDMPGMDGLEFLEAVRERETGPERPFVLFTGKGSEAIASRAISAGVTDYLQKGSGETYDLLANRIRNAVESYRSRLASDRCRQVVQSLSLPICVVDADGRVRATNRAFVRLTGRDPADLEGGPVGAVVGDGDVEDLTSAVARLHDGDGPRSLDREVAVATADGERTVPVTLNRLRAPDGDPAAVALFHE